MTGFWTEDRLLVGGELVHADGGATYENVDPATGEVIGVAADASRDDMARAVAAARRAFDDSDWSRDLGLRVRCLRQLHDALRARRDEFKRMTVAETGTPIMLTHGPQVGTPLKVLDWYADLAETYEFTQDLGDLAMYGIVSHRWIEKEAVGVVGAITPWNFPTQINLAKIAPALAAGCTVVLKPAPDTPWSGAVLGQVVAEETEIPAGVLNVVTSSDKTIGEVLSTDPRVDLVSFTGSTATGRRIMRDAADTVKRLFLELGGKSASIVLADADLEAACAACAFPVTVHAGQGCAITTRALIPRDRFDDAVEILRDTLASTPFGDPMDEAVLMGPLVSASQLERVDGFVRRALSNGARAVTGGKRPVDMPERLAGGFWYEPTLLVDVGPSDEIAQQEVFGPVLVAMPYEDDDDAVAIANDSIYGLSGAVFSSDVDHAIAVARRIRTGSVSINGGQIYGPDVPFGGYRQSGIGREMGVAGFEEYLESKAFAEPST